MINTERKRGGRRLAVDVRRNRNVHAGLHPFVNQQECYSLDAADIGMKARVE